MTFPLIVLAFLAVVLGFAFNYDGNLGHWISWGPHAEEAHHGGHVVMYTSLSVFLTGLLGAWWIYMSQPPKYEALGKRLAIPHYILSRRYMIDEVYLLFIAKVYYPVTNWFAKTDYDFVDQFIVDGVGRVGKGFSWVSNIFDGGFIDRVLVDGNSDISNWFSTKLRKLQSGLVQSYMFLMILGLGIMLAWIAHNFK
jgi:NADH-quinone oxidoreductase subunit L